MHITPLGPAQPVIVNLASDEARCANNLNAPLNRAHTNADNRSRLANAIARSEQMQDPPMLLGQNLPAPSTSRHPSALTVPMIHAKH
jgi:hypothetical protein